MLRAFAQYLTKPHIWALRAHRRAHRLWVGGRRLSAQLWATWARVLTGIDIAPGAEIGENVRITHGTGIVIGDTAVVGDGCRIFQGVTLGRRDDFGRVTQERVLPRLGRRVFVGANAILLGPITVGDDAVIGAGAVVLCDVPPGCTAVGNPARILPPKGGVTGQGGDDADSSRSVAAGGSHPRRAG